MLKKYSQKANVLVLENCILLKQDQPDAKEVDLESYLAEFALD